MQPISRNEEILLPYKYVPRPYQIPVLTAIDRGTKGLPGGVLRAAAVWHRRSGKDLTFSNFMFKKMEERIGSYYYLFPTYTQGEKILWRGMDKTGFRFMDHYPQSLRKRTDNTDMIIESKRGSIFQIIGTDKIDRVVGTNPVGIVFSEWSLQNPMAWDFMRPILAENGGWAIFDYTPRGENHGYDTYKYAQAHPESWFADLLTVDNTGAISREVLDQERKEIIAKYGNDALYQQEYYCNFKVPIVGAYYAAQIMKAIQDGRITKVPWEANIPVDTWWDLGIDDSMTIWFSQTVGKEIRFIDYHEYAGEGMGYYIKMLKEKPYVYGTHTAPHDITVRELTSGKSRRDTAKSLGIDFEIAERGSIEDGIDAVRMIFSRCWFDEERCRVGLNALKSYHKGYDEVNKVFRPKPVHDWSSHGSDAFRTFAVKYEEVMEDTSEVPEWAKNRPGYSRG